MTERIFVEHGPEDRDLITFGTPDRTITIDVTFIPASKAYKMLKLLVKDPETNRFSDETYAETIALFTDEVDAAWIVENTSFKTLDTIVAYLIGKAFPRPSEKN